MPGANLTKLSRSPSLPYLLDARTVARHFSVKQRTIYDWAKRGILTPIRVGGLIRFDPGGLRHYIQGSEAE